MIYAEKEQNESPFVSINTVARGRILPSKQPDGISEAPSYQTKKQEDQSQAPSIQNGEMLHSKEKPNDFMTNLEGIDTNVAKIKKNSFITEKTIASMDEDAIIGEEHPSSSMEPTESTYEKLKKKSQSNNSFWRDLYAKAKNFFTGYGAITDAERMKEIIYGSINLMSL